LTSARPFMDDAGSDLRNPWAAPDVVGGGHKPFRFWSSDITVRTKVPERVAISPQYKRGYLEGRQLFQTTDAAKETRS
jgi:hypothetical protein